MNQLDNLTLIARKINLAESPEEIFGVLVAPSVEETTKLLQKEYHKLVKVVFPDRFTAGTAEYNLATETFKKLSKFAQDGIQKIKDGMYNKEPDPIILTSMGKTYTLKKKFKEGPIANIYHTESQIVKVSKIPKDNDLLENEVKALNHIRAFLISDPKKKEAGEKWLTVIPKVNATFPLKIDNKQHRVNVLTLFENMINLNDVSKQGHIIDGRTSGWIFKRVVGLLAWVHASGYIHGALTPDHLLIRPDNYNDSARDPMKHAVIVVDWCYSTKIGFKVIAWNPHFAAFYPPEIKSKQVVTAATDVYMLGATMLSIVGGDFATKTFPAGYPSELSTIILSCLEQDPKKRPSTEVLFNTLVSQLKAVYGPPKWHNLIIPKE